MNKTKKTLFHVPDPKPLDQVSALIIDQNALDRDAIKNTLHRQGVGIIRAASGAHQALYECKQRTFEIIIIAFDLHTDRDGFHLFEELKFKGYINNSTCVIFLSADTDQTLVYSVIELQPDDFWTKPLDQRKIEKRLLKILETRKLLHSPFYCADIEDYSRAIYYAERYLKNEKLKAFHPKLQRLIGNSLCTMGEYADAEKYYTGLVKQAKYGWVLIGLTYSLLKQGKMEQADAFIDKLKKRPDTRFAVHDLLANYYVEENQFDDAYLEIQKATEYSPRNIERNKRFWDLARLNHDSHGQYTATMHMAKYAKNSIHDSPELTLNVIRAGIDLATSTPGEANPQLIHRIERQLTEFQSRKGLKLDAQLKVVEARVLVAKGDKREAEKLIKDMTFVGSSEAMEDSIDAIKLLHAIGEREKVMNILNQLKAQVGGDTFSSKIISRYIEQEIDERSSIHFSPKELMEMAKAHHEQGRLMPAYQALHDALRLSPTSVRVALFALQVLSEFIESTEEALTEDQCEMLVKCFSLLDSAKLNAEHQKRLQAYHEKLQHLLPVQEEV